MASLPPSVPHLWLEYDDILAASSSSSCNPPNALYHPTQVFHYEAQVLSDSGGPLIVFGSEGESKELTNLNGFDGNSSLSHFPPAGRGLEAPQPQRKKNIF